MLKLNNLLAIATAAILLATFSGCDFSARGDLKDAEKALKEADKWHADQWAGPEYRKAQDALVEAMDYAKVNLVNEARDKANEAKSWAEEATTLSMQRYNDMEKEKDKLGGYKP